MSLRAYIFIMLPTACCLLRACFVGTAATTVMMMMTHKLQVSDALELCRQPGVHSARQSCRRLRNGRVEMHLVKLKAMQKMMVCLGN